MRGSCCAAQSRRMEDGLYRVPRNATRALSVRAPRRETCDIPGEGDQVN